jgi:hypothetical protein
MTLISSVSVATGLAGWERALPAARAAVITNKIATIARALRTSELLYGWRIIGVWRWWRLNVRSLLMMPETTAQHHRSDEQRGGKDNTQNGRGWRLSGCSIA